MNPPQTLFTRDGVEFARMPDTRSALAELRRLGGPWADITVSAGRINVYAHPFHDGADNSPNLVAYAMVTS